MKITVPAFDLTSDFVQEIQSDYGVKIASSEKAPYEVTFEGPTLALAIMLREHWQMTIEEITKTIETGVNV